MSASTPITAIEFLADIPHYVDVLWPVLKLLFVAAIAIFALTACGGGGGGGKSISDGPGVTQPPPTDPMPDNPPVLNPPPTPPPVNPNADLVSATGMTDSRGVNMANFYQNQTTLHGKTLKPVETEYTQAFRDGWTGKGSDVLVLDTFQADQNGHVHGETVRAITATRAPGARITAVDVIGPNPSAEYQITTSSGSNGQTILTDRTTELSGQSVDFKAVNLSYGSALPRIVSAAQAATEHADTLGFVKAQNEVVTQGTSSHNVTVSNAVIVKAAGNEGLTAQHDSLNVALMNDTGTRDRTILVGAKEGNALANYSNTCGNYCDKFVVADGSSPYVNDANNNGTSYAAPRVTAIAAVVRQKFSNINAARAAEVILKTARTDTISNYNQSVHGMGEASMTRALSPIGNLR